MTKSHNISKKTDPLKLRFCMKEISAFTSVKIECTGKLNYVYIEICNKNKWCSANIMHCSDLDADSIQGNKINPSLI